MYQFIECFLKLYSYFLYSFILYLTKSIIDEHGNFTYNFRIKTGRILTIHECIGGEGMEGVLKSIPSTPMKFVSKATLPHLNFDILAGTFLGPLEIITNLKKKISKKSPS